LKQPKAQIRGARLQAPGLLVTAAGRITRTARR
jgi:hypothetical protein